MKVLVILTREDLIQEQVTAVVYLPEGGDPDKSYLHWARSEYPHCRDLSDEEILRGNSDVWQILDVLPHDPGE